MFCCFGELISFYKTLLYKMPRVSIKYIFHGELSQTKRKNIKKIITIIFILELKRRFLNEILPSNINSRPPKVKNIR